MQQIAAWLGGELKAAATEGEKLIKTGVADVDKIFDTARAAADKSPLPINLKQDATTALNDAQADLASAAGAAGTELGAILAKYATQATNLVVAMTADVVGTKAAAAYSPAERAAVAQGATVIGAAIATAATQIQVGITPAAAGAPA